MYKEFRDENAEKMTAIAKSIKPPVERFTSVGSSFEKTGPISSQFFPQEELFVHPLDTTEMVESLAGSEHAEIWRFRLQMKAQYPDHPEMWNIPFPVLAEREWSGGAWWVPPAKARNADTLSKTDETVRELYRRAASKGMNLGALSDEVKESLRDLVKQGKITLVEQPGKLSIALA